MNPRFLVGVGLRSSVHTTIAATPSETNAVPRMAALSMATAVAAEAQDQRIPRRIKDRLAERFR